MGKSIGEIRLAACATIMDDIADIFINKLPDMQSVMKASAFEFDCICGRIVVRLRVAFDNATSRMELAYLFASKALLGFLVSMLQLSWSFLFRDQVSNRTAAQSARCLILSII